MAEKPIKLPLRAAIVAAAFVAGSGLMLGVGALFDDASREPWLRDSPLARAAYADCAVSASRRERRLCMRRIVAEARAHDAGLARMAAAVPGR